MRRWLAALVTALVTSGLGVAINVATDSGSNAVAWVIVVALTAAAALVAIWAQRPTTDTPRPQNPQHTDERDSGTVHNQISGNVTGSVVQARDITGPVIFDGKDHGGR